MHTAVLCDKVIEYLDPKTNQNFIDCTLGSGGHTFEILKRTAPKGRILGIDQDEQALFIAKAKAKEQKVGDRLSLAHGNFATLQMITQQEKFRPVHGILFDLGLSSDQLERSGRGFSFQKSEPLDMKFNTENPTSAEKILNFWSKRDLERMLREYGEEMFSGEIAETIVRSRAEKHIKRTDQLVDIILQATPKWYHAKKIHAATRTFQALRIMVNQELDNLKEALPQSVEILENQGTLVVISFHSLEDRIVKNFLKEHSQLQLLTKKPVMAGESEIKNNPRSRSAKLRA
ncbi:MAG: 16S rRNA (cytosine(1402)-N(4))-methyltransferase RsmH, partial [bacterium]|nr:16S rRNA (cytosine(1402)-N(4))-methyltransferase RsmH [bacterium]